MDCVFDSFRRQDSCTSTKDREPGSPQSPAQRYCPGEKGAVEGYRYALGARDSPYPAAPGESLEPRFLLVPEKDRVLAAQTHTLHATSCRQAPGGHTVSFSHTALLPLETSHWDIKLCRRPRLRARRNSHLGLFGSHSTHLDSIWPSQVCRV